MTAYNRAIILVIISGVFLSTLGIGTRLLESANGLQVVFYRSIGLLALMLTVQVYQNGRNTFKNTLAIGKPGLICSLCLIGTSIFIVQALLNTSVANAMFIISLAPLVAGLFAWLILGEKMSAATMLATAIALVGVLIIIQGALSTDGLKGIAFAFGMLACYGLFSVSLRMGKNLDMLPCISLHALLLLVGLGVFVDDLSITQHDLIICLLLGVFQLGLGLLLFTLSSKHVPAAQLTLLAMLEVVLSPIWVWLGVDETPSASTLIGGAVIIGAISFQAFKATRN